MITAVDLTEWQTLHPVDHGPLQHLTLDESGPTLRLVRDLAESRLLGLDELRQGLRIRAFSHVGRVRLGDLQITVRPKIEQSSLLNLLRYAYGFRKLRLLSEAEQAVDSYGFEDLLVSQLNTEVREILDRGVHRAYIERQDELASPRGRIDVDRIARSGGSVGARLPCRHYPRVIDTHLNRLLLSGLRLAANMASDLRLARESHRLADQLDEQVSRIRLDRASLALGDRLMNRLTAAYDPAMAIIRLLLESHGVSLDDRDADHRLPGFLFDMNAFFQALIGRFLTDNLAACEVVSEYKLKRMMQYAPRYNPLNRRSPTPRPDYVLKRNGRVVAILDAKYRDLWEQALPREMLYQLVVYAISHRDDPRSAIIYPTSSPAAREQRIEVTDPVYGRTIGNVSLRPVNLAELEASIAGDDAKHRQHRRTIAERLSHGSR